MKPVLLANKKIRSVYWWINWSQPDILCINGHISRGYTSMKKMTLTFAYPTLREVKGYSSS